MPPNPTFREAPPLTFEVACEVIPKEGAVGEDKGAVWKADDGRVVFMVCDGIGSAGPQAGIAANIAMEELGGRLYYNATSKDKFSQTINQGATTAINKIRSVASNIHNHKIGTTFCGGVIFPDGTTDTANVGDSNIYVFRPTENRFYALSVEDSAVGRLHRKSALTEDEAFEHPNRNVITSSLPNVNNEEGIHMLEFKVLPGDVLLAVTDGITDNIRPQEFRNLVARHHQLNSNDLARTLSRKAYDQSQDMRNPFGKPDDISVVVVKVH